MKLTLLSIDIPPIYDVATFGPWPYDYDFDSVDGVNCYYSAGLIGLMIEEHRYQSSANRPVHTVTLCAAGQTVLRCAVLRGAQS